jgi:hypothetical protein
MPKENLLNIYLYSQRGVCNGSSLISGLETNMDSVCSQAGGMCDARFEKTLACTRKIQKKAKWFLLGFMAQR